MNREFFLNTLSRFSLILEEGVLDFANSQQSAKGFNAKFLAESDIATGTSKTGFKLASKYIKHSDAASNILCIGPPGSGKSVNIIAPNIYDLTNVSIILNDAAKQFYPITSGFKSLSHEIKILDFSDSTRSSGYNILSRIRKKSDINKIAYIVVYASFSGKSSDPYWQIQAESVIVLVIRIVLAQENKFHNIANCISVLDYIAVEPERVDEWVVRAHSDELLMDWKKISAIPDKTRQNVISTALSACQAFQDSEILKVISSDTLDIERMRRVPTLLYLQNSIDSQKYVKVVNSIFYEQLFGYLLSTEVTAQTLPLYIIMDEASSCMVPSLGISMANTRKTKTSIFLAVQALSQLTSLYGKEAEDIISNCSTRIYMPGINDLETLRSLEALSGKYEYRNKKGEKHIRSLATIDEIRTLSRSEALVLYKNKGLVKTHSRPYFESAKYRSYAVIPPVPVQSDIPNEPIELFTTINRD